MIVKLSKQYKYFFPHGHLKTIVNTISNETLFDGFLIWRDGNKMVDSTYFKKKMIEVVASSAFRVDFLAIFYGGSGQYLSGKLYRGCF